MDEPDLDETPSTPAHVAAWALDLAFEDIPSPVIERTRSLLLDTLGVGVGAGRTPAAGIAYELACRQFAGSDDHAARLAFDGRAVSPAGAAYAFATRIDNLDAHDGYQPAKGHAGVALVPTLLAVAEAHAPDTTGREALAALVAGYEVACRAGTALHGSTGDYHSSGAWNALGAATVAARLRGYSTGQLAAALGVAEYHAPRAPMMREIDAPSMLHDSSGWGALAGMTGAELAGLGFAASPPELVAIGDDWATLGEQWRVLDQYVKPHPVCFWAQPAVTAALRLQRDHAIAASEIRAVRIHTFHEATRLHADVPGDTQTAQYALAFPVAAALVRGRLGPAEVTGAGLEDRASGALAARVTVEESRAFSERFPGQRLAAVSVQCADGREIASGPTEPRGTPGEPMDDAAIRAKFDEYARPILGRGRTDAIAKAVAQLGGPDATLRVLVEQVADRPGRTGIA